MFRKFLQYFSGWLLRGHHAIRRRLERRNAVAPRRLHYQVRADQPLIVHVNGNFGIGGTSQLIADILEQLSPEYRHEVIVPALPDHLPYQPLPAHAFSLANMQGLYDHLKERQPALVHIHYWIRPMHRYFDFGIWYRAVFDICTELGLPVIQNIDVPTAPYPGQTVLHNVYVSRYVLDSFNNSPLPASVIYPGSDLRHFSAPAGHTLPADTVGMVYRLDTDKLNEKAIEVFISAVKKKPSLTCYIIGGGYYYDDFRNRVREAGQEKNFVFTGFVSYEALPEYYRKIGLIVAPVHDESFGQVTPFAMSMGIPVAGFDTGALKEILGTGDLLVPYGDVEALADKIVAVSNDPALAAQTGAFNKNRAGELFSLDTMIRAYRDLYQQYIR